jgi:ferric-dicitrate binding protein FerR (iron transport regulator)
MNEETKYIDPEILIGRYLNGEASGEEIQWLEKWVKADPANRQLFLTTRKAYNLAGISQEAFADTNAAWKKISNRLKEPEDLKYGKSVQMKRGRTRIWAIAAALIVLVAAFFWWFENGYRSTVQYYQSDATVLVDELPDGSTISLNRRSRISFEQTELRKVKLVGDAFFEVRRDENRPFVVQAGEIEVQVLGTSFYINAQSQNPQVEVLVRTGLVVVRSRQDSLILRAGQRAAFNKRSKELAQTRIDDVNYLSWKTGTLVFDDQQLDAVIRKLNEVYSTKIVLENRRLENCRITVTFKQQNLEAVLRIIEETLDVSVEEKGDKRFLIRGPGCKE